MDRKRFGGLLMLTAALLCTAGCSLLEPEGTGVERELLCQFRAGSRYAVSGNQYWEEKDPGWNTYWMIVSDQHSRPEEVRFTFTEDVEREVFALDKDYQIVWNRTFGSGKHSMPVQESVMGIMFSAPDSEPFHAFGTGMHPQLETPLTGRRLSVLGDSVSAFSGFIPWDDLAYYSNMNFGAASMWWAVLAEHTGMEICRVNAVSGSGVIVPEEPSPGRSVTGNSDRCRDLSSRDGEEPDEIVILLGGNDYLNQIPPEQIKQSYLSMLAKIRKEYPDARIHICTYFESRTLSPELLEELNGLLRSIAEEAGAGLIDLAGCGILSGAPEAYLIDGALHPNERGQILIGARAAQQLLESGAGA